ncbi:hypothetical protein TPDSL_15770 [Terrisporobacter petrolearius]|uniref:HNH endonuclease n=1 Tax=Terrisporobacter petrolearius TaxID=1460447 RepID=UPI003366C482
MAICLYCGKEFNKEEMTREHVIPQVIGGNIHESNPFIIENVCKRCNNTAGIFIDGIFAKQFLVKNKIDTLNSRYTDLNKNQYIPLSYMGKLKDFEFEGKICEFWLGPTGDVIYHFHDPYKDKLGIPMIGKPTYIKPSEIDQGYVFLYIVSNNPIWQTTVVNSVKITFAKSEIYLGNGSHEVCSIFSEIPKELNLLHDILNEKVKQKNELEFSTSLHANDRFIFKTVLGMGGVFLKDEFILNEEADRLRKAMWGKTNDEIKDLEVSGSSFYTEKNESLDKYLSMNNCHLIALIRIDGGIAIHISLFGDMSSTVMLTKKSDLLKANINDFGIVYVIAPGLNKCIGPIDLENFIGYKNDCGGDKRLYDLEAEINNVPELPPHMI